MSTSPDASVDPVQVEHLTIGHHGRALQRDLNFRIGPHEIFVIMGGSGCGKSTLLRHLMGLEPPMHGRILIYGRPPVEPGTGLSRLAGGRPAFGAMFQAGALWTSMSVGENVMLPMEVYTDAPRAEREAQARHWLGEVELGDSFDLMPSQLSGGMRKRAAIARALALQPHLLFLDEPSAGLDPVTSARLDRLLLRLRDAHDMTLVIVTHELQSLLGVADRALFLDAEAGTMTALGDPRELRQHGPDSVRAFLNRETGT